ncbi:transglycosylase SLT domain-containing protein [bacterium]|nr:transglycosylase SLT domain-containing protein [bacterium]
MDNVIKKIRKNFIDRIHQRIQHINSRISSQKKLPSWAREVLRRGVALFYYTGAVLLPSALGIYLLFTLSLHLLSPTPMTTEVQAPPPPLSKKHINYDFYFSKYTQRYFGPTFDWKWFKAQALAESKMKTDAVSYKGAKGLMQLMPRTFDEITEKNPVIQKEITHPEWSIAAGIYYNRKMWKKWKSPYRPFIQRVNFMFASYNAGFQNILKAQKLALKNDLNPYKWESIKETLPHVTGVHSQQTIRYINKIHKYKRSLD